MSYHIHTYIRTSVCIERGLCIRASAVEAIGNDDDDDGADLFVCIFSFVAVLLGAQTRRCAVSNGCFS